MNIQAKTVRFSLTANNPNTQVVPSSGKRITVAFSRALYEDHNNFYNSVVSCVVIFIATHCKSNGLLSYVHVFNSYKMQ